MNDKQSAPDLAQPLERGFEQLTEPLYRFVSSQTSGIILLLAGTLAAIVFANTSLHSLYLDLVKIETGFFVKDFELRKTLQHWVNDGLMVLFFFCWGWGCWPAWASPCRYLSPSSASTISRSC